MWCWNSCWVGSALSFPVGFSSNSKKWSPIWGPRNLQKECAHPNGWRDKHTHIKQIIIMMGFDTIEINLVYSSVSNIQLNEIFDLDFLDQTFWTKRTTTKTTTTTTIVMGFDTIEINLVMLKSERIYFARELLILQKLLFCFLCIWQTIIWSGPSASVMFLV